MLDGRHTGTGGGNHFVLGGATAGRLAVPAPARPARQPDRATGTTIRRCRTCSRACSSARPARRRASTRRATTRSTRSRSRSPSCDASPRQRRQVAAVAGRPPVPQPADRRHRQHPPRRVLHRQAVLARRPDRPPRPARDARLRDAAACAHEPGAAAADARAGRALLARALPARAARALGHRAARPLHAAALRLAGLRATWSTSCATPAIPLRAEWFAPHFEFRFPRSATSPRGGVERRAAHGARALARAGRGERAPAAPRATSIRRSSACRCKRHRPGRRAPRAHLQRPARAAAADRQRRRVRRRRALPRLAAAVGAASDHRRARAAHVRSGRHLDEPLARRLPVPRRASGRPQLRRPSRSTPTRPRRGAWRASSAPATRPGTMNGAAEERNPDFPFTLDLRRPPAAVGAMPCARCGRRDAGPSCSPATRRPRRPLRRAARRAGRAAAALGRVPARARRARRARGERHARR